VLCPAVCRKTTPKESWQTTTTITIQVVIDTGSCCFHDRRRKIDVQVEAEFISIVGAKFDGCGSLPVIVQQLNFPTKTAFPAVVESVERANEIAWFARTMNKSRFDSKTHSHRTSRSPAGPAR
jgi:hypothetical protein